MSPSRRFSGPRLGVALSAALVALAIVVGPTAAQTEIGHTGVVGFHTLKDTSKRPGATCTWTERHLGGGYFWQGDLTRISVRPPRMSATPGSPTIGWRFVVQRSAFYDDFGPWKNKYSSPIQWETTDTTLDSSFTRMGVDVHVPTSNPDQSPEYFYRVRVKMFWKNSGGDVIGTATHEVNWYRNIEMDTYPDNYYCRAWQAWVI